MICFRTSNKALLLQVSTPLPVIAWSFHSRGRMKNLLIKNKKNKAHNTLHPLLYHFYAGCFSLGTGGQALI